MTAVSAAEDPVADRQLDAAQPSRQVEAGTRRVGHRASSPGRTMGGVAPEALGGAPTVAYAAVSAEAGATAVGYVGAGCGHAVVPGAGTVVSSSTRTSSMVKPSANARYESARRALRMSYATSYTSCGTARMRPRKSAMARALRTSPNDARGLAPYSRSPISLSRPWAAGSRVASTSRIA